MKYSEIENRPQYNDYCKEHLRIGKMLGKGNSNDDLKNDYYILGLIIKDYESGQKNPFEKLTPVDLLKALMEENSYTGYKLSKELTIPQSTISDILNYRRSFSKDVIRKLADKFNLSRESFLKEYELINKPNNVA